MRFSSYDFSLFINARYFSRRALFSPRNPVSIFIFLNCFLSLAIHPRERGLRFWLFAGVDFRNLKAFIIETIERVEIRGSPVSFSQCHEAGQHLNDS